MTSSTTRRGRRRTRDGNHRLLPSHQIVRNMKATILMSEVIEVIEETGEIDETLDPRIIVISETSDVITDKVNLVTEIIGKIIDIVIKRDQKEEHFIKRMEREECARVEQESHLEIVRERREDWGKEEVEQAIPPPNNYDL